MKVAFAAAAVIAALAITLFAVAASAIGSIDPGVVGDDPGGLIRAVDPQGIAWAVGVRPGQRVEAVQSAEQPGGWTLDTSDGATRFRVSVAASEARLRDATPIAVLGLLVAILGVGIVRQSRRRAELASLGAIALASVPLSFAEVDLATTAAIALGAIAPVLWLVRWTRNRHRATVAAASAIGGVVGVWGVFRLAHLPSPPVLGPLVACATAAGTCAAVAIGVGMTPDRVLRAVVATRALDVTVGAAAVVAMIGLSASGIALPLVTLIVILPLLGYARARAGIAHLADRLLLAEIREREAIRATEQERSRMSREIHDDPLQALAGVIRQLEDPDADPAVARDSLREVAAHLRGVATDLHPPVLDDLGLVGTCQAR